MIRLITLRLLESYFRHRLLYLLPLVLMIAASGVFVMLRPPQYNVVGNLMVNKDTLLGSLTSNTTNFNIYRTASDITVEELNELLATNAFVRTAIQKTELEAKMSGGPKQVEDTFDEFRNSIVFSSGGEKLVKITGSHENGLIAQQVVSSTMDAFIQWQINKDYQESVVAQNFFASLIQPYQDELKRARDEMQTYLQTYPDPLRGERPPEEKMEIARLESAIKRAEDRVTEVLKNEESARLALVKAESLTRQTYLVVDVPEVPQTPPSLVKTIVFVVLFIAVGLILALFAVIIGAIGDRSLRFPIDVRHRLSLPVLGVVPTVKPNAKAALKSDKRQSESNQEREAARQNDRSESATTAKP